MKDSSTGKTRSVSKKITDATRLTAEQVKEVPGKIVDNNAHQTGEYAEFIDGQLKGGLGAGSTVAAVSLVGVAGGPAGAALLAGVAAGVLANMATKNVSVAQIGQFMAEQTPNIANAVKEMAARGTV